LLERVDEEIDVRTGTNLAAVDGAARVRGDLPLGNQTDERLLRPNYKRHKRGGFPRIISAPVRS
jgi:hypothetical protein